MKKVKIGDIVKDVHKYLKKHGVTTHEKKAKPAPGKNVGTHSDKHCNALTAPAA